MHKPRGCLLQPRKSELIAMKIRSKRNRRVRWTCTMTSRSMLILMLTLFSGAPAMDATRSMLQPRRHSKLSRPGHPGILAVPISQCSQSIAAALYL